MGMGGSQQASPPTIDAEQSASLLRKQLEVQRQELPSMSRAAGDASRSEYRRNINFGLRLLNDSDFRRRYEEAMPDETRRRNALLGQLDAAQSAAPEYTRLQEQLQGSVGERVGMLSAEQQRDAVQGARAAMSARGLATGSAGAAAEILNRDRYMQQRRAQDLNILGRSSELAEQERSRRLGLGQSAYNFAMGTNPNMMAIGSGSSYANMAQPSMALVGQAQGLEPMYSGGQLSQPGWFDNMITGASIGMSEGSMFGPWGAAGGAIFGGIDGAAGGPIFKAKTGQ